MKSELSRVLSLNRLGSRSVFIDLQYAERAWSSIQKLYYPIMAAVVNVLQLVNVNLATATHYTLRYRAGKLSNCF